MVRGDITFVSGGVRSGKTAHAEGLLEGSDCSRLVYVATGLPADPEMEERISRHRQDRGRSRRNWVTIERPIDLPGVLTMIREGDGVLVDCITTWLANAMYEGFETGPSCHEQPGCMEEKIGEMLNAVVRLAETASAVVIVSNEVLDEPSSGYEETRKYAETLGRIHRQLVKISDRAIEMDAGIPHRWK